MVNREEFKETRAVSSVEKSPIPPKDIALKSI